ncbi:MAG: hypothetical protein FWF86_07755 [Clostridia bacterium]|nr:hypothetical protein [Clostridia bacterium]
MKSADDKRVQRLQDTKKRFRETYSRLPFGDWLRKTKKEPKAEGIILEKHDVLAMIIAALSLVLPWVLGGAAVMGLLVLLLGWLLGSG